MPIKMIKRKAKILIFIFILLFAIAYSVFGQEPDAGKAAAGAKEDSVEPSNTEGAAGVPEAIDLEKEIAASKEKGNTGEVNAPAGAAENKEEPIYLEPIYLYIDLEQASAASKEGGKVGKGGESVNEPDQSETKKEKRRKIKFIQASNLEDDQWGVENYYIEIGDILEISVWQIENLQREVVVRPDGKISFPLIGDVQAQSRTIEELRSDIVDQIKVYIKSPQVSVNIIEFGGKKAIILGEIWGPGVIRFSSPTRIIEAIGLAGDFRDTANKDRLFIIRDAYLDDPTIIVINANSILKDANLKENILVHSGDIIYVPRAFIADFKFFMDNVFGPVMNYSEKYYGETWRRKVGGYWLHPSRGTKIDGR